MANVLFRESNSHRPKIVVIGGGTGLSVVLNELKGFNVDLTAIVAVADDGGSSGTLRKITQSIPPGDLRNVISSLSTHPQPVKDAFQYRFKEGNDVLSGHPLGNLIISGLAEKEGNYYQAITKLCQFMQVEGRVLPSSEVPLTLCARFTDGSEFEGETTITSQGKNIDRVFLKPSNPEDIIEPGPEVVEAIMDADLVVLGPGSLFTSILPNLLIEEVGQAVVASHAKKVYICNIMTQKGETEGFTDADHVAALYKHLGEAFIDIVLVNNERVPDDLSQLPSQDENLLQVQPDFQAMKNMVPKVISDNFLKLTDKGIYHDGHKIGQELYDQASDYQRIVRFSAQ